MSKYIIDVGDEYIRHGLERTLTIPVRINEHEDHWMDTRIPATPYTEPDTNEAYQRGYEEGYAVGEAKKNSVEDEAYQRGLNDAWEAARTIAKIEWEEKNKIFGKMVLRSNIFSDNTAAEAIEKIRQYEQEQKQEEKQIQVGDEVRNIKGGWIAVVSNIDGECMTLMDTNGALGDGYDVNRFTKTGRHFPEIAAVLAKMKEES